MLSQPRFLRRAVCGSIATGALIVSSFSASQTAAPVPSIRIIGFATTPVNTCTEPAVTVDVLAAGDVRHSDSYSIVVDGRARYQWAEGETMAWANTNQALPYGLTSDALTGSFPANTIITGQIVTYNGSNPAGPVFTAGEAVFVSQISWNCTTGQQIGPVSTVDLRPREPVPLRGGTLLAALLVVAAGLAARNVRARG